LSVTSVSKAQNGTRVGNVNGMQTCAPPPYFNGTAGFDYTVSDGSLSDIGHVTITVTAVNDAPVAVDDTGTTAEDVAVTFTQADQNGRAAGGDERHAQEGAEGVDNAANDGTE